MWLRSMHMQILVEFHWFVHKSENQILTITKGHNCVANLRKWVHNNPNLDLVNVIEYAKDLILIIHSQDIEWKWTDRITDKLKTV